MSRVGWSFESVRLGSATGRGAQSPFEVQRPVPLRCRGAELGVIGWLWMAPTSNAMMIRVIPIILGARFGLGFVAFPLQSLCLAAR